MTGAIQQLLCSVSTGVLLINSSAKSMIVTGGVDSICRLWAVGFIMDKASDRKDKIWRVRLLNKMEGHSLAIMDILHHPNDALVSTLDDSLAQFSQMDSEEKERKIALSQSELDIAEAIASKVHHEDLVVALNTPNRFRAEGATIKKLYSRSHFTSRYAFGSQLYSMTQFLQMEGNEKEKRFAPSQSALEVEEVEADVQQMLAEVKRQDQLLSVLSAYRRWCRTN